jgi:hypothetical protein
MGYDIQPDGEAGGAPCSDCGARTRSVWGYVSETGEARAVYFARWTESHVERGLELLVSVGPWGEGATPGDRSAIGVECRLGELGPGFMVIDAASLPWEHAFLGTRLARDAALAHPQIESVFAILDEVVAADPRIRAFLVS